MSSSLSHLITLTMSVMWVARLTLASSRCERSPSPVMVGVNTLWPRFSSRSDTRRQHQPPCQAPCTSTKVLALVCACAVAASRSCRRRHGARRHPPRTVRRVEFVVSLRHCSPPHRFTTPAAESRPAIPARRPSRRGRRRWSRRSSTILSALHSASALSNAGCGYFARADVGLLRHLLARAGELDRLQRDAVRLRRQSSNRPRRGPSR